MTLTSIPSEGSSGGPIIDIDSGAVVGVMRGSTNGYGDRQTRGFATPAEKLFEVRFPPYVISFFLPFKTHSPLPSPCSCSDYPDSNPRRRRIHRLRMQRRRRVKSSNWFIGRFL